MQYAFGRSYKRLEALDFDVTAYEAAHQGAALGFLIKHFVFILRIAQRLPDFLLKRCGIALAAMVELRTVNDSSYEP